MRKPRDFDADLKTLEAKARQLKERKVQQLGELVVATGADALTIEELAGALLAAAQQRDGANRAAWRSAGEAFFRGDATPAPRGAARDDKGDASSGSAAQSPGVRASAS